MSLPLLPSWLLLLLLDTTTVTLVMMIKANGVFVIAWRSLRFSI